MDGRTPGFPAEHCPKHHTTSAGLPSSHSASCGPQVSSTHQCLCMYICICMCVYMYMYVCIYMYVCMYVCMEAARKQNKKSSTSFLVISQRLLASDVIVSRV